MLSTSMSCDNNANNIPIITSPTDYEYSETTVSYAEISDIFNLNDIPDFTSNAYVIVNNNIPFFTEEEITTDSYELYSNFDELGRCGAAIACLSKETMPAEDEERGEIGMIKPVGWHTVKYPDVISDLYLYNRCHLIGWQLSAENANEYNLITGTRYLNVEGMLPFENEIDDYIEETNNHVMYRVTPIYVDDELLCRGVLMEAMSVEDENCTFCIYCYNVQPGIEIDYKTGNSWLTGDVPEENETSSTSVTYILNTKSMKIHNKNCKYANKISDYNKSEYTGDIEVLFEKGYTACGSCNP